MDTWKAISVFYSEEIFLESLHLFNIVWEKFPKILEYVKGRILGPMKEKGRRVWSDSVIYNGSTTSIKL